MKRCMGIQFLNDCEYAVLLANGYGCRNRGDCEYQRPRVPGPNYTENTPKSESKTRRTALESKNRVDQTEDEIALRDEIWNDSKDGEA